MVIDDVKQIDRMVEKQLSGSEELVSVDMDDYARFKQGLAAMRAVKIECMWITPQVIERLQQGMEQAGRESISGLLLHIGGRSGDAISMEDANLILREMNALAPKANLFWGVGSNRESQAEIEILLVIGYA